MNNSFLELQHTQLNLEEEVDISPSLRAEEMKLVKIIQAIEAVAQTPEWQILKENIFDGTVESLERMKSAEASQQPINTDKIHSINGQLAWAKRYSNFSSLTEVYRKRLKEVKDKLNAKNRESK